MRRLKVLSFVTLSLALVVTFTPTRGRNRLLGWIGAERLVRCPAAPPFDGDVAKVEAYQDIYARGYLWAWRQDSRTRCPPHWSAAEWVREAWLTGFTAGSEDGGSGELPLTFQPEHQGD